ncbi:hypothetical protein SUGI_0978460 [Cryptomeria japonica]|nr:hypothetical protein SUGI_0978460 [Cryptomeria japonica]
MVEETVKRVKWTRKRGCIDCEDREVRSREFGAGKKRNSLRIRQESESKVRGEDIVKDSRWRWEEAEPCSQRFASSLAPSALPVVASMK